VWGSPEPHELDRLPSIPAATVGGPAATRVRALLADVHEPMAQLTTAVRTGWWDIPLLVADVRAPATTSEQFALFSGHVDSWHLGAMDNAGANAVMIEVARLAGRRRAELRRHLRLAFWSGHSHGRYAGSARYVDEHWDELDRACAVHLNIDSVGARGATVLTQAPSMPETYVVGADAIAAVAGQHLDRERFPRAGDQSLANLGVASLFLTLSEQPAGGDDRLHDGSALVKGDGAQETGGLGWWWHTPEDTVDKLDRTGLARDAEVYLQATEAFLLDPVLPLDVAAAAQELDAELRRRAVSCAERFDLSALVEESARVVTRALRVRERCDQVSAAPDDAAAARLSAALMAADRPLVRVAYVDGDRFGHDDTAPRGPIPLLAPVDALLATTPGSDAEQRLRVTATRRRNRVLAELRLAADALEKAIADAD
jgi:hypothetical protein